MASNIEIESDENSPRISLSNSLLEPEEILQIDSDATSEADTDTDKMQENESKEIAESELVATRSKVPENVDSVTSTKQSMSSEFTELKVTSHRKDYDYETNIQSQPEFDDYFLEDEFSNYRGNYLEDENEDKTDIYSVEEYEDFVTAKLNFVSYKEKANLRQVNNFLKTVFLQHKESCIEKYEILAVRALFDEKDVSKIETYLQCDSFLKTLREKGDPFGFVTKVTKNNIEFSSYLNIADYFAACFFYKNLRCAFLLKDSLNKLKYRQIKSFFQDLLNKNLKLHEVCQMGLLNEVKVLLFLEIDVNKIDENGVTPLHLACAAQNLEIVGLLIKNQANVNASDEEGYSPLHLACQFGNLGLTKLLLKLEANPYKTTNDGLTPLDIAYDRGFRSIVNLLNVQKKPPATSFNMYRAPPNVDRRKHNTKKVTKKSQTTYSEAMKKAMERTMEHTPKNAKPKLEENLMESGMATKLQSLNLKGQKEINILLLGETGVGKSTFINSIANYFTFSSYETAREAKELEIIVPSYVTVQTLNSEEIVVEIGSDKNECQTIGAAGTQNVKTYVFPLGETKLRLIDTPGMGDPRGIEQDDINCENILGYLSQLKELHAICFLMRPTTTRKTVLFEYCVQQILTRLEKSASKNIVFIFTNSRGTNYTPGDTLPCIKDMINKIKSHPPHVEIPINMKNTFSVDNESFKYLVVMKEKGILVDEMIQNRLAESWTYSSNECWRLISYIVGDTTENALNPHQLQNTISINEARRMIERLSQPLADVSQLIQENIASLEFHKHNLTMDNQSLDEMKRKLYIPAIKLKVTQLDMPTTVCTNAKCAELVRVDDNIKKWHYRQRCHDPCNLKNVPKEIIGDKSLLECAAMNGNESCQICGCSYSLHMHIYYETETFKDKIIDNVVENNIQEKEQALTEITRIMTEMNQRKQEFEQEREVIVESCAKFAHFLQNNSICPLNDSYRAYIEYLIMGEEKLKGRGSREMVAQLKKLLQRYNAMRSTFETLQNHGSNASVESAITAGSVLDIVNQLYKLKHNGAKIREMIEKQKMAITREFDKTCEYIYPKKRSWFYRLRNKFYLGH